MTVRYAGGTQRKQVRSRRTLEPQRGVPAAPIFQPRAMHEVPLVRAHIRRIAEHFAATHENAFYEIITK